MQGDQLYMDVCFWNLAKHDLSSIRHCTRVHWTSHFLQDNKKIRPCITGHPVEQIEWNEGIISLLRQSVITSDLLDVELEIKLCDL